MPHLTIAQKAKVALAVSGLLVTVALVLDGLKVAFSVFVLIWGRIAAMVIVGEEIRGVVSRFFLGTDYLGRFHRPMVHPNFSRADVHESKATSAPSK